MYIYIYIYILVEYDIYYINTCSIYIYICMYKNLSSSSLLSKNLKIKMYRTIILSVVLYGCETWSLTLTH